MKEQLLKWRRDIHAHPELSFAETRTSALAEEYLKSIGFSIRKKWLKAGFYADFGDSPKVALRCEMDALAVQEANMTPYVSTIPNVSHACGHDAHVACLLGAATLLREAGTPVRLLLQTGEEVPDDEGVMGARHAVTNGALEGIDTLVGIHVDPTLPTGTLSLIPMSVDRELVATALVSGENLNAKFDIMLSGARKAELSDLQMWLSKRFPSKDYGIEWTEQPIDEDSISADALLDALSTVSSTVQVSKRKTWSACFTEYSKLVPCAIILVGCEIRGDRRSQHTARFDIDEECLPIGASALAAVVRALNGAFTYSR
jgi:metal-dependent amidase/aminoacylase/carboxypeptidase family protein